MSEHLAALNKLSEAIDGVFKLAKELGLNDTDILALVMETAVDYRLDSEYDERLIDERYGPMTDGSSAFDAAIKRHPSFTDKLECEDGEKNVNSDGSNVIQFPKRPRK